MSDTQLPFEVPGQPAAQTATPAATPPAVVQPEAGLPMQQILNAEPTLPAFSDKGAFEHAQRVAKMLCSSSLVPKEYQGNVQNTMIALEMANRMGASPLQVMQNLNIIQGRPSWSSQFIISAINSCKRFSPLRFVTEGEGEEYGCYAWAYDSTKEKIIGPKVTMKMANAEGWTTKGGSKWKTMPELMLRYRSAAFFGRLYAPDVLMGMYSADEAEDIAYAEIADENDKQQNFTDTLNKLK